MRDAAVVELAAEPAHQDVDRAVENVALAPAGEVEQLIARQHAAWPLQKRLEQIELSASQRDLLALGVGDAPLLRVCGKSGKAEDLRLGLNRQRFGAPTQHRADAGDQLARVERLTEIIVGANLKADDAVDILFQCRKENDRHVGAVGSEVAAHVEAGAVGQHHVEDDEIDVMRRELVPKLTATRRELHAKALSLDIAGEELPDFRIVIDDKNALGSWAHLTGKKDMPSSVPVLASPRRFNEGIFVTKTNCLERQQCSDTNLAPQAIFGHA